MWHKIESNHLFSGGVFCSKYFSNALAGSNIVYGWLGGFYWTISYLCFQIFLGLNYCSHVLWQKILASKISIFHVFECALLLLFSSSAAAAAKLLQLCPTLCNPIDGSPWGSPVPGILQARTLEWVAISFSNAWEWKVKVNTLSRIWLLATPWTAAYQAPPSMGSSRQEHWSGVPLPSPKRHAETLKRHF